MSQDVDVVVVGAGVIGLATAAALAGDGRSVILIERNSDIAQEATARNSEVIHAGIYYPPDSLKAAFCVAGCAALYARCKAQKIPHRRLGKLIVATEPRELEILESLFLRGTANGVSGLELIDSCEVSRLEPCVNAVGALLSPATGIIDSHALCCSYRAEAEALGVIVALCSEVIEIEHRSGGYRVCVRRGDGGLDEIFCAALVNAAGLASDALAECAGFDVDACNYRLQLCKGDYFTLAKGAGLEVSHLIYPVPAEAGLGIHVTIDLSGRLRLGPDVEYVDSIRYDIDPHKREAFAGAVRGYLPALNSESLSPDYSGVRAKLAGPREPFRDFVVREESKAGRAGFVNLIGIDSPGLTAAPAIAGRVVQLLASL